MEMPFPISADLNLFDRMPAGLAVYDTGGVLIHSNAHFDRVVSGTGMPSVSQGGAILWHGLAGDGAVLAPAQFPCQRALRGEVVVPGVDLLHSGSDGNKRWLNVSASPICDPAVDAIVGIVLLFLDAQERVEAGCAARAGLRFQQFAENSGNAIWIADAVSEELDYRNPEHLALGGDPARDIRRLTDWLDQIEDADRAAVRRRYDRARQGTTEHCEYQLKPAGARGPRRIRETVFAIRDAARAITMLGGIAEDITPAGNGALYLVGKATASAQALARLFGKRERTIKSFPSIAELLNVASVLTRGCVLVDLASVGDAEANLTRAITDHGLSLPVIIIGTSNTPVAAAVAAMRNGAADYLIPPFDDQMLIEAILRASTRIATPAVEPPVATERSDRVARLTKREREVLSGLSTGGTNKSIARDLGISPRTVELHRSHLMERMNVRSLAELLRTAT